MLLRSPANRLRFTSMRYFEIYADDITFFPRWYLRDPVAENGQVIGCRLFTYARLYAGPPPATVPVKIEGPRPEFTLGPFRMPVVSATVASKIAELAAEDIELYPVRVGDEQVRFLPPKQKRCGEFSSSRPAILSSLKDIAG